MCGNLCVLTKYPLTCVRLDILVLVEPAAALGLDSCHARGGTKLRVMSPDLTLHTVARKDLPQATTLLLVPLM